MIITVSPIAAIIPNIAAINVVHIGSTFLILIAMSYIYATGITSKSLFLM